MKKISNFFHHLNQVIKYQKLPAEKRQITFYSEGKNYWAYLEPLLTEILETSNLTVCYITSGSDDPVLSYDHPRLLTFIIDEGFVRNWLFENIQTKVMIMTMPDIHQYQVKRSRHKVHYLYTQHSLVSFHMVYRPGAFDYYDTVFCSGPYHLKEMRAIEAKYNLPAKKLVEHGYVRLDAILSNRKKNPPNKSAPEHVLFAPSWGENGTIELGIGEKIVDTLLQANYQVTLRPHPMTLKYSQDKVHKIVSRHKSNPLFTFEDRVDGQQSLHDSDVMVCDWSGAALDYAFGLGKPVLFIDVPRKVNNPNYNTITIEPFEVSIREKIGRVVPVKNKTIYPETLLAEITKLPQEIDIHIRNENIFNVGNSAQFGAKYILRMLEDLEI